MFWDKKEDKSKLPDLPPYQRPASLSGQPGEMGQSAMGDNVGGTLPFEDKNDLPSFPDPINNRNLLQNNMKSNVVSTNQFQPQVFPESVSGRMVGSVGNSNYQTVEMEEWTPSQKIEDGEIELPSVQPRFKPKVFREPPKEVYTSSYVKDKEIPEQIKNKDLFVRLDKFYSARKALIDAQQKLGDIDELLRRIRETKMREEQELNAWEKELMNIKARMNDVTVNLFEKID